MPLQAIEVGELGQVGHQSRILRPERFFIDGQRLLQQPFGFVVCSLGRVHEREVIEAAEKPRAFAAVSFRIDGQCAFQQRDGFLIVLLGPVKEREIVETFHQRGVVRAGGVFSNRKGPG